MIHAFGPAALKLLEEKRRLNFLCAHPVAARREVREQDELALETAHLETVVCLGDLIEGDPLRDARPDDPILRLISPTAGRFGARCACTLSVLR